MEKHLAFTHLFVLAALVISFKLVLTLPPVEGLLSFLYLGKSKKPLWENLKGNYFNCCYGLIRCASGNCKENFYRSDERPIQGKFRLINLDALPGS
jgi:hypothetical protein